MSNSYKSYFDIPAGISYLSTPGSGLLPTHIKQWRRNRDEEFFETNTDLREKQGELLTETRNTISRIFGAKIENTFLSSNFSTAFNTVLDGIPQGAKILVLNEDYPSILFPIAARQFEVHSLQVTANLEENLLLKIEECKAE